MRSVATCYPHRVAAAHTVCIRLFATLREVWGAPELELPVRAGDSVRSCWEELCDRRPELRRLGESVRPALNRQYVDWDDSVAAGDELAFLPPVSGGATETRAEVEVRVTSDPLDPHRIEERARLNGCGAIATFVGVVRDPDDDGTRVPHLDYEAYQEMAEKELALVAGEALDRFSVHHVLVHHRTGRVLRSEPSVVVVVSAPHRQPALQACAYVIDELKARAPIWKSGS